jgi:hypothetical protein
MITARYNILIILFGLSIPDQVNVFIAGMVRAGSMWTYNVARYSIRRMGITLIPDADVPVDEKKLLQTALQHGAYSQDCFCIKTHEYLPLNVSNTKIICNYRDVRDAMISHMRFMRLDFELGLQMVQAYMDLTDHYCVPPRSNVMKIRYDDMVSNPVQMVREINRFIGFEIDKRDAKRIAKKILHTLTKVELDESGKPLISEQFKDYTSARNVDGSRRAYHLKTGFSENHITATVSGEWRAVLDSQQQERLMALSKDWLLRYGFEL